LIWFLIIMSFFCIAVSMMGLVYASKSDSRKFVNLVSTGTLPARLIPVMSCSQTSFVSTSDSCVFLRVALLWSCPTTLCFILHTILQHVRNYCRFKR
jgi:hypothetical protein